MIPISFEKIWDFIHLPENQERYPKRESVYKSVLGCFNFSVHRDHNYRQTFREYAKSQRRIELLPDEKWDTFLKALRISNALEGRKLLRHFVPPGVRVSEVSPGIAELGEIELRQPGANFLDKRKYGIPADLLEISVDKVKFLKYIDKAQHKISVREGRYINIKPPPRISGGVALGVDEKSGDVVLISQFRYGPDRFLTEAPRGFFAVGEDENPVDAAVRELHEETGFKKVQDPIILKYSYTDSGIMSFRPVLCLVFVDKNEPIPNPKLDAAMSVPIWLRIEKFYEAVLATHSIDVERNKDFSEIVYFENRDTSKWQLPTNKGKLEICDNFTVVAAMLAVPHLTNRYKNLKRYLNHRLLNDYS